jgi:hypothetical protein
MAKFLLVGLATDGPSELPVQMTEAQAYQTFGGAFIERRLLAPTASTILLTFTPRDIPHDYVVGLGRRELYFPSFTDNLLTFGTVGGTGSCILAGSGFWTVDLSYTPYLGKSDLLACLTNYRQQQTDVPWIARIGGTTATYSVSGWTFEAKYPGAKYNRLTIAINASSVVISGMAPEYATLTYTSATPYQLYQQIQQDFGQGRSPVQLQAWVPTLPAATGQMSGGADGSFSAGDVEDFLAGAPIPAEVTHVVFLAPLSSAMVESVDNYMFDRGIQPRLILTAAPAFADSISTYVAGLASAVPYRHNMIGTVLGTVVEDIGGRDFERYAVEAVAAAFNSSDDFGMTNLPLKVKSFTPELTEAELTVAKNNGLMPLMRYIRSGIAVYQSTTTTGDEPLPYSSKLAELYAACRIVTEPYIGTILPDGPQPLIRDALFRELSKIRHVQIDSVTVDVYSSLAVFTQLPGSSAPESIVGALMQVVVEGVIYDEILSIQFFLSVQ